MLVVHTSFNRDRLRRSPSELIRAWPTLIEVAAAAASSDVQVSVVIPHEQTTILEFSGIQVFFQPHVRDTIRRLRPDLVHIHGLSFATATRSICSQISARVLVQDHGGAPPRIWRRPVLRWGFRGIHGVAFTAREQADTYQNLLPPDVRIFEVLESSSNFTPGDQAEERAITGLYGDPCVLWVGRLNRIKDPLVALEAVRVAAQDLPGIQLWCCYSTVELLADITSALQADPVLASRVHLLGRVTHERMQRLFRATDFFVSSSHSEGSGYALIEALACGATPVVTDIPSFRAITGRGRIGKIVQPGDARSAASALVDLARQSRDYLRSRAIQHFNESLTFDVVGNQLRQAYETLLA